MKFKALPLEHELAALPQHEVGRARSAYMLETMSTKGFQLVTGVLRNLERAAMQALRSGTHPRPERLLGRLECIEAIRASLVALLPDDQQPNVDWFDEEEEAFVNVDGRLAHDDDNIG